MSIQMNVEAVVKAICEEPELPGPIPEDMYKALQGDRDACAECLRILVRKTKEGIIARLVLREETSGSIAIYFDNILGSLHYLLTLLLKKDQERAIAKLQVLLDHESLITKEEE
jgi:hypothetical protein